MNLCEQNSIDPLFIILILFAIPTVTKEKVKEKEFKKLIIKDSAPGGTFGHVPPGHNYKDKHTTDSVTEDHPANQALSKEVGDLVYYAHTPLWTSSSAKHEEALQEAFGLLPVTCLPGVVQIFRDANVYVDDCCDTLVLNMDQLGRDTLKILRQFLMKVR